jgi:hypothetical protein
MQGSKAPSEVATMHCAWRCVYRRVTKSTSCRDRTTPHKCRFRLASVATSDSASGAYIADSIVQRSSGTNVRPWPQAPQPGKSRRSNQMCRPRSDPHRRPSSSRAAARVAAGSRVAFEVMAEMAVPVNGAVAVAKAAAVLVTVVVEKVMAADQTYRGSNGTSKCSGWREADECTRLESVYLHRAPTGRPLGLADAARVDAQYISCSRQRQRCFVPPPHTQAGAMSA